MVSVSQGQGAAPSKEIKAELYSLYIRGVPKVPPGYLQVILGEVWRMAAWL
jgi:hypothetical protein